MVAAYSLDEDIVPIAEGLPPSILPQCPSPAVSADSSRAPSFRGTTACNSPRTWSFEEKVVGEKTIHEISDIVRPVSFSLVHAANPPY